ncbi:uncharacterized protein LOC111398379 [Olea europaea var. sylvestris]|uniref:uncharacterized protein LOC111398379 n=1 Tax=Olea europaea var. sylvestris TaxID=158386 RepID=UPI000C1CF1A4|nr:uncharacterized protein LOC111398379 [Olea europaea var. sylvestris]
MKASNSFRNPLILYPYTLFISLSLSTLFSRTNAKRLPPLKHRALTHRPPLRPCPCSQSFLPDPDCLSLVFPTRRPVDYLDRLHARCDCNSRRQCRRPVNLSDNQSGADSSSTDLKAFLILLIFHFDENDVGDVDVDVEGIGDVGDVDVGDVGDIDVGFGGIGDVRNVEDIGNVGDSGGNVEDIGDVGDVDVAQLPSDAGLRVPIQNYDVNIRDVIQRAYMQRGPCQPRNHIFPLTRIGKIDRRFCVSWHNEHPTWLEYSIAKDAADSQIGKRKNIRKRGGASSSAHNQAWVKYELFKNQEQSIRSCLVKQSHQARTNYQIRLNASIECVRFLLRQGMAFCGYDKYEDLNNQGNFFELLHWLCDHNPEIKAVALTNAPENLKLTSPRVQKNIVSAIASECLHVIIENVRDSFVSILVDESRDISVKEQMSVVIRYVKNGCILEHFIGVIHVLNTTAASLKVAIDQLFSTHSLSISNLRGQ